MYANQDLYLHRLGRYGGVNPIGSLSSTVNVGGRNWELWEGYNGAMKVYSYVAPSPVTKFDGNLKPFFNHMATRGFPQGSQYLISKSLHNRSQLETMIILKTDSLSARSYSLPVRNRALYRQQRQVQHLLLLRRLQLVCHALSGAVCRIRRSRFCDERARCKGDAQKHSYCPQFL